MTVDIFRTKIYKKLKVMQENKQRLVLTQNELLKYWNMLPRLIQISCLKNLSRTIYGLQFRGHKIEVLEDEYKV